MIIFQLISTLQKGGAERVFLDICTHLNRVNNIIVIPIVLYGNKNDYQNIYQIKINYLSDKNNGIVTEDMIKKYQELEKKHSPDIIHCHMLHPDILVRNKISKKIQYFTHFHANYDIWNKKKKITDFNLPIFLQKKRIFKKYKESNTKFITISKDCFSFYKQNLPKSLRKNIYLIPNSIDYKRFYKPQKNIITGKLKLINVGSFQDIKNQEFILEITKELLKHTTDFEITLLGDGKNKPLLEQQCKTQGLEKHIIFKGNVNNVEEYLHNNHIYLHTSLSESFGLVFLEAMAAGLPVVTLDGKGNRDIIEQNKNGYLFYEENAKLFTKTILDLKQNTDKYSEMSEYCKVYSKKFNIEQQVDKFVEFYKSILK